MLRRGCFASPLYEARMRAPDLRTRVNLPAQASLELLCFSLRMLLLMGLLLLVGLQGVSCHLGFQKLP